MPLKLWSFALACGLAVSFAMPLMAHSANEEEREAAAANPATEQAQANQQALSDLLQKADLMNREEIDMAKVARDKAGDNQALVTLADTIRGDHQANEDAVKALASQRNIQLNSNQPQEEKSELKQMKNLKGAAFNDAYLKQQVEDHRDKLNEMRQAESQFKGDRDVETYLGQTLPVLEAHLKMSENLHREAMAGSRENPANNQNQ